MTNGGLIVCENVKVILGRIIIWKNGETSKAINFKETKVLMDFWEVIDNDEIVEVPILISVDNREVLFALDAQLC